MTDKVIINARGDISWKRRVFSDIVTAGMWIGWMFLWLPVYRKLREAIHLRMDFGLAAKEVLDTITPISLTYSIIALLGTSILLLLWTMLPRRTVTHAHEIESAEDYASTFGISVDEINAGRASRITVVSHDAYGNIIGIAPKA